MLHKVALIDFRSFRSEIPFSKLDFTEPEASFLVIRRPKYDGILGSRLSLLLYRVLDVFDSTRQMRFALQVTAAKSVPAPFLERVINAYNIYLHNSSLSTTDSQRSGKK